MADKTIVQKPITGKMIESTIISADAAGKSICTAYYHTEDPNGVIIAGSKTVVVPLDAETEQTVKQFVTGTVVPAANVQEGTA